MTTSTRRHTAAEAVDAARAMLAAGTNTDQIADAIAAGYDHICNVDPNLGALYFAQYGTVRAHLPLDPEFFAAEQARVAARIHAEIEAERDALPCVGALLAHLDREAEAERAYCGQLSEQSRADYETVKQAIIANPAGHIARCTAAEMAA